MKGKGKGDRNSGQHRDSQSGTESMKDCPLQFPDLAPVEHTRLCPRYTAVLQRSSEDGIGLEEADTLQTELETLLASVAKRMRLLENEIDILASWQDKARDKKVAAPEPKRSAAREDKPNKKFKNESGKASQSTPGRTKGKVQNVKNQDTEFVESPKPPELPRLPKNDVPNRFWQTVEPYCADITNEDLKVLEDLTRSHEGDAEYHKVPGLGKHYSQKWAQEDMLEEQKEGSRISDKRKSSTSNDKASNNNNANEVAALLKRAEESSDDASPFGPLTQRLVCALIEENIMTPLDDTSMADSELNAAEAATMSPRSLAKQLNIGNSASLERRIKRELEEQGILEFEERPEDNPEDEILSELRKKQQELRVLSQHNMVVTKRLYKLAKEEMQRQDLRKKIIVADAEVMEAYRKIQAARSKKKTPSKKEKESAWRAIKEREALVKQLDAMG